MNTETAFSNRTKNISFWKQSSNWKRGMPKKQEAYSGTYRRQGEKNSLLFSKCGMYFQEYRHGWKYMAKIIEEYPELKNCSKGNCIPVWWFINALRLFRKEDRRSRDLWKHGNCSDKHSNGKAEDVVILISLIKQKVRDTSASNCMKRSNMWILISVFIFAGTQDLVFLLFV